MTAMTLTIAMRHRDGGNGTTKVLASSRKLSPQSTVHTNKLQSTHNGDYIHRHEQNK